MSDSPGTAAPAAASAEAEATMRARAATALAGSGSSSGAPAVGAASPSDDLATWLRQVEAEFVRVHARLDGKTAEISTTTCSSREVATACADQVSNFDIILRQFVDKRLLRRRRCSGTAVTKGTTYNRDGYMEQG